MMNEYELPEMQNLTTNDVSLGTVTATPTTQKRTRNISYKRYLHRTSVKIPRSTKFYRHKKRLQETHEGNNDHREDRYSDSESLSEDARDPEEFAEEVDDGVISHACDGPVGDSDGPAADSDVPVGDEDAPPGDTDSPDDDSDCFDVYPDGSDSEPIGRDGSDNTSDEGEHPTENLGFKVNMEQVSEGSSLTKVQLLILIFSFIIRHQLSDTGLSDLLLILNLIQPDCVPRTKYLFYSHFKVDQAMEVHFYCGDCTAYIGKTPDISNCPECDSLFTKTESEQKGNFFLYLPIGEQIKDLFENHGLASLMERPVDREYLGDISDGLAYKQLKLDGAFLDNYSISLMWNSDGVPLYKSSKFSLTPIQCIINEIPPKERSKYVLLAALWFGSKKPKTDTLFYPFVEEMKKLNHEGFTFKLDNQVLRCKVCAPIASVDTPARAALQNIKQFNGKHGCNFCLHPGETVNRGDGHARVYPLTEDLPELRSRDNLQQHATQAIQQNKCVYGVKGPVILSLLPRFDLSWGFVPDYMHAVYLGVVRTFFNHWFDSSWHDQDYYIGQQRKAVDEKLCSINPPHEVSRLPRSLSESKFWKATEWRNFLFYSPIILQGILPSPFLRHWWYLVYGIYNLTGSIISQEVLEKSNIALCKFVWEIPNLYGSNLLSYNVHLLTHLCHGVRLWGPLWTTSAFVFEDFNQKLIKFVNGTRGAPNQICNKFLRSKQLGKYVHSYLSGANDMVLKAYSTMTHNFPGIQKAFFLSKNVTGLGAPYISELSAYERLCIERLNENRNIVKVIQFSRFVTNGILCHTEEYSRRVKRSDFVVHTFDKSVVKIEKIFLVRFDSCQCNEIPCICQELPFIMGFELKTQPRQLRVYDKDVKANLATAYCTRLQSLRKVALHAHEISGKCLVLPTNVYIPWLSNEYTD